MNKDLRNILSKVKKLIESKRDSTIYVKLGSKIDINNRCLNLTEYISFLRECNGGRFGIVDLWSYGELPNKQFRIGKYKDSWLEIGQILYEPLLINKKVGKLGY